MFRRLVIFKCFLYCLLIASFANGELAFGQIRICEIKFGERALDLKSSSATAVSENPWKKICYQIGVEHDSQGNPEESKPIYACCRDPVGAEVNTSYSEE